MLLATGKTAEDPRVALDLLEPKRAPRKRKQPGDNINNDGNAEEPGAHQPDPQAAAAELDPGHDHEQEGLEVEVPVEEGEAMEVQQDPDEVGLPEPALAAEAEADADTDIDEILRVPAQPVAPAPDGLGHEELLHLLHSNRSSVALWQSLA